ncbi:hypothetical protein AAFF_G00217160 [Aldrovandia affinis]|uniref:SH3 domain-containing protein n=1 Tax=Aldrovandia affinis TaxID=143900 RepID=A0AAD7SWZ0_9TELE|nr:hypothetical protein AAFF_G00217160 [Aldrovandia affinis]
MATPDSSPTSPLSLVSCCFPTAPNPFCESTSASPQKRSFGFCLAEAWAGNECEGLVPSGRALIKMWSPYLPSQVMPLSHCSADRSDELSARRSDIIQVLCRDNGNWWPGRSANGDRGCFPANREAGASGDGQLVSSEPGPGQSEQQKPSADMPTPTEACGAMDSAGELSFISEHDTDSESSDAMVHKQQKKKKKKKVKKKSESPAAPAPVHSTTAGPAVTGGSGRKKTPETTGRPLPKRGQTNRAFEPDFEA